MARRTDGTFVQIRSLVGKNQKPRDANAPVYELFVPRIEFAQREHCNRLTT
jgi:hypothetical protein